jgi:hypothetical protein
VRDQGFVARRQAAGQIGLVEPAVLEGAADPIVEQVPRHFVGEIPQQIVFVAFLAHRCGVKDHAFAELPQAPLRHQRSPDVRHPETAMRRQVEQRERRAAEDRVLRVERAPHPR